MPTVQIPGVGTVQFPDAMQPADIQHAIETQIIPQHAQAQVAAEPKPDPSAGGGTLSIGPYDTGIKTPEVVDRVLSGAGKAMVDLGRGAGQLVGAVSRDDVAAARQNDAPLMATTAGKVGNFAGNVAATVPAAFIPGANTVAGAAAVGAGMGLLQPSESTGETLKNVALGGVTGGAAQKVGGALADAVGGKIAARSAASDAKAALNADRDAVLQTSKQAGYVVPPTAVNPSATNTALESISGKAATRQVASARNQQVTNSLIRDDLGIPATTPLTRSSVKQVISDQGKIYQDVKDKLGTFASDADYSAGVNKLPSLASDLESSYPGIGAQSNAEVTQLAKSLDVPQHNGADAVSLFKQLNERSSENFKAARGPNGIDSQKLEIARAQSHAADEVGGLIQRQLASTGDADLATAWQQARTTIAKSYQVLGALKGNDVSATALASQLQRGKLITGNMKTVADFANHFSDVAKLPKSGAGVSKLAATVLGSGEIAAATLHSPALAAGALGAAVAPYATRSAILSRAGQAALATPNYAPSLTTTAALRALYGTGRSAVPLALGADATKK